MRSRLSLFLALVMLVQPVFALAQAPAPSPTVLRVSQGTVVAMKPPHDIRSDKVKTGDVIDFLVVQPIKVNGVTVVDVGAKARVTITEARHAAGFGQQGRLKLAVNTVEAVDGTRLRLRGSPDHKGGDNTAVSVAGIIIFSVFFVFLQGKEAVIKADKELTAYIDEDRDFVVNGASTGSGEVTPAPSPGVKAVPSGPSVVAQPPIAAAPSPPPASASPRPGAPASAPSPLLRSDPGSTASAPAQGGTEKPAPAPGSELQKLVVCHRVNVAGKPTRQAESFGATVDAICAWFKVGSAPEDRVFEVRWYCGDRLATTSSVIVRASQGSGSATMRRKGSGSLARGGWRVDVLREGRVLGSERFTVTF